VFGGAVGYPQLLVHPLFPALPTGDCSGLRICILSLPVDPYRGLKGTGEPVAIAVDSTGISVHKAGGWIESVHGKKKRYVKLHFAVNTESHEVVAMEVSTDDAHDVEAAPGLVEGAERNVRVVRVYRDGAYDSGKVYRLLESRGVEVVIKPRRNSRVDSGPPSRRRAVPLAQAVPVSVQHIDTCSTCQGLLAYCSSNCGLQGCPGSPSQWCTCGGGKPCSCGGIGCGSGAPGTCTGYICQLAPYCPYNGCRRAFTELE